MAHPLMRSAGETGRFFHSDSSIPCPPGVAGVNKFIRNNNALQVFHALITDLRFYPYTYRSAMGNRQVLPVHSISQDGLRVEGIQHVDAFHIAIVGVEIDIAGVLS